MFAVPAGAGGPLAAGTTRAAKGSLSEPVLTCGTTAALPLMLTPPATDRLGPFKTAWPAAVRASPEVTVGGRVVAPAFCWAEVGSVLRKKVRAGEITVEESVEAWADFQAMPIDFLDESAVRDRAWSLAERFAQPTLYDAAYLAVTELPNGATREFWTADQALFDAVRRGRPSYVHHLSELSAPS